MFRLSLWDETEIAEVLQQVHQEFGADVAIGSYPVSGQQDKAQILVSLDSRAAQPLEAAAARMRQLLPPGSCISEQSNVATLLQPCVPCVQDAVLPGT